MSHTIHHVQLFSTLPVDPLQRMHRLRSTRKLEAILGTTPPFLDLNSMVDIIPKSPISPRTKAMRRKGQVFQSQSDSVFVNVNARPDLYRLPHPPSPCYSLSPDAEPVTRRSGKSGETHAKHTKTESPQILTQPFLLRLRSLPVPATSIKSGMIPVDQSKPLSPITLSFDMDMPTALPRPYHVMTDNEKRKKLAKLTRTLGENVPPELVFRSPSLQRATSMSVSRLRKSPPSHKPSSHSIPSPVAESLAPQPQSAGRPEKPLKQQSRPRSMTLTTNQAMTMESAIAETRGAMSLDHATSVNLDTKGKDGLSLEWGKRREKDWSGEWNVKDMEYVAKALRGLKGR